MKKILILLSLFLGLMLSLNVNAIEDVSEWYKCQDKLEKQKIDSKHRLCADKYAEIIPFESYTNSATMGKINLGGNIIGKLNLKLENLSSEVLITKIVINGILDCKNQSVCTSTEFTVTRYPTVEPGAELDCPDYNNFMGCSYYVQEVDLSKDPIWTKDISWSYLLTAYGFKIDY